MSIATPPQPPRIDAGAASAGTGEAQPASKRRIVSEQLFAGAQEVLIEHHGLLYRLRRTSLGKLILTK